MRMANSVSDEIDARHAAIARFAGERLVIRRGDVGCSLAPRATTTRRGAQQTFVSLELEGDCAARGALEVQTSLFFGSPGYSLLIDAQTEHGRFSGVLTMATDGWTEPPRSSWFGTLLRFLSAGIWHVAIGYDHVAFLLLLLLPSVLHGSRSGWAAATSLREVARDLARIVTAFTVAHSITLGLSATSPRVPAVAGRPIRRTGRACTGL